IHRLHTLRRVWRIRSARAGGEMISTWLGSPGASAGWSQAIWCERKSRSSTSWLMMAASIGVAGSVMGTFVVLRREALLALALPQTVAVGAAVGLRMRWPTLPPALVAAAAALVYLVISRRRGAGGNTIPALYISGLS